MLFGIDKQNFALGFLLLVLGISNACSQTKEMKFKESELLAKKALELRLKGDIQGAIQVQSKAIEVAPENHKLLIDLVVFYMDASEYSEAESVALRALQFLPNDAWLNNMYAEILVRKEDNKGALSYQSKAVEIDPKNPVFISNLASIQESLGDRKSAKENFLKTLEIQPNFIFALLRLGQLEEEDGNIEAAEKLYYKALNVPKEQYENVDQALIVEVEKHLMRIKSLQSAKEN